MVLHVRADAGIYGDRPVLAAPVRLELLVREPCARGAETKRTTTGRILRDRDRAVESHPAKRLFEFVGEDSGGGEQMLDEKVCLVTGAAQGIGRATALEMARQGAGA